MNDHSLDVLTDAHGRWVPVGGILRWRGEYLAPEPRPKRIRQGKRGVCGCGEPAYTETALYCLTCKQAALRAAWRRSANKRRGVAA